MLPNPFSRLNARKVRRTVGWLIFGLLVATAGPMPYRVPAEERPILGAPDRQISSQAMVHLYFGDPDNRQLKAENRSLPPTEDPTEFGRTILMALIQGPQSDLTPTLPKGTELKAFFITEDGKAYADFNAALSQNHPGGTQSELLTVYSIVNSLLLNMAQIEAVKILIAGREPETLAGHVCLQYAYNANMLLIQ